MQSTIRKWGNSLALRLPRHVVKELRVQEGATVSLAVQKDSLIVKPTRKRYRLEELLEGVSPDMKRGETDWGPPVGKEVW